MKIHTFCCRNSNVFVLLPTIYIPYSNLIFNFKIIWLQDFPARKCGPVFYDVSVFPTWTIIADPTLQWVFIRLAKGCYPSDHFSVSLHRLLNVPDMRRTTEWWPSVGRSVGLALFGQTEKKMYIYIYTEIINCQYMTSCSLVDRYRRYGEIAASFIRVKKNNFGKR